MSLKPWSSDVIDQPMGPSLPGTIGAAIHMHSALDSVTHYTDPTSPTRRRKRVNSALKRIKFMCVSIHHDCK